MSANPFLDPVRTGDLYADVDRIAQRTGALSRAKISGQHPATVIADLAATAAAGAAGTVLDIGCGRGTSTLALAERLQPPRLIAFDASAALLARAQDRLTGHANVQFLRGDFHAIALPDASIAVAAAAFCLYHSPRPVEAISEIARCLKSGGLLITVTKSRDSYQALDEVISASGLDPAADQRPSLYETFHSDNHAEVIGSVLDVRRVIHHEHRFRFADAEHVAAYALTNPKYQLPQDPGHIAAQLQATIGNRPLEMQSRVSYALAVR